MRRSIFFLIIFFLIRLQAASQNNIPDTLVIFGVDFSLAKIATDRNYDAANVLTYDISRVNSDIIDLIRRNSNHFRAKNLIIDSTDVLKRNSAINPDEIFTRGRYIFSGGDAKARSTVVNYNSSNYSNGVGILFVMEKIDEIENRESFYLIMFDLETKKIIHCDKVETGLSRIKGKVASGWFSWKTGLIKVIHSMDNVYDFWNNYPEREPVDIRAKIAETHVDDWKNEVKKRKDTIPGVKNWKIITLNCAINLLIDNLDKKYKSVFSGPNNVYATTDFYSTPKGNISFQYGLTQKFIFGGGLGYDQAVITWEDTVLHVDKHIDTWTRYQLFLTGNYCIVNSPKFIFYIGPQLGYNIIKYKSSSGLSNFTGVDLSPLTGQVNIGVSYFIKGRIGINHEMAVGFGSCDFFKIGITAKF